MVTVGVYKSLSKSALYEHGCLGEIKNLYKSYGKCNYQHKYKAILEAFIVSTPEVLEYNSPMDTGKVLTMNNPSSIKSLTQFLALLNV